MKINCLNSSFRPLQIRSSIFWDVMQRTFLAIYQRFRTAYVSHLQGSSSPVKYLLA
jgi:hypothetical protein